MASRQAAAGHEVEVLVLQTAGDRRQDLQFHEVGPPGVFVREIERALAAGEVDAAVHSYKDLPSESPEGLIVAAVPAPAQGALAVQVRTGDPAHVAVEALDDPVRRREVETERHLLALVEGGCRVPVGAWCRSRADGRLALTAFLEVDGRIRRAAASSRDGGSLACAVAGQLLPEKNE